MVAVSSFQPIAFGLPRRPGGRGRHSFTLIELLVAIGIVGIISGILLAGIQKVREASNRAQCLNNLRQIGIGAQNHVSVFGHFPTGGWGWSWVGDPDRGSDQRQPGGWIFNLLPFVEQDSLYRLGSGLTWEKKLAATHQRLSTPVRIFNCPSRRSGGPYPNTMDFPYWNAQNPVYELARSDYAANTGDNPIDQYGPGPPSLKEGDAPGYKGWHDTSELTGIVFERSRVRIADITRGTSNTYLAGEKYLNPDGYTNGLDSGDNENMYVGFDNDVNRTTSSPPLQDTRKIADDLIFGSAHAGRVNMVYCDGSARTVSFSVEPSVHQRAGNRR
jgi:prepilin-type N-terminal cleavage/methylation domain-containing protein/prepilin-type processing-associated H-X9-DG protein